MKKILFGLMMACLLVGCSSAKKVENSDKYINLGQEVIKFLNQGDFEKVKENVTEEMKEALNVETCDKIVQDLSKNGEFESFGKNEVVSKEDKKENHIYFTVVQEASYKNAKVIFTITFDENDRLGGLYYK
ncbi:DUF3887 domain-containing protein [Peptoniphilus indolicus]|uniref:DUF3887 domain-containing protein n=2 Tax=Peptoniphilus indolicus TaxID=33030 RepID=G4D2K7_9FIRM|nr:DUF3887 domain-containing protein [Peptoniphilus indolicus]EGY80238.1 hypothetical protein HMPREF9129_0637 [Peptoniphilus indolicus ATCC 29427]SUB75279.1 Uncharacterised protein [Peptoniphilus indolicus]